MVRDSGTAGVPRASARRIALLIFAGLLLFGPGPAATAGAAPDLSRPSVPVVHEVNASPDSVTASWSREDLLRARPVEIPLPPGKSFDPIPFSRAPGPETTGAGASIPASAVAEASISAASGAFFPGNVTAYPQRVHGRIFFLSGASAYSCSGTLVNSRNRNVLFTAGHCVFDRATGKFVSKLVFIPGYENGSAPLGTYAATSLLTTTGWIDRGSFSYDIAAVALEDTPEDSLGSRKIAFDLDPGGRSWTIYGYPEEPDPPYDGQSLVACDSKTTTRDAGVPPAIGAGPCDMEQGASGGGWITDGKYLNSVVSYGYCDTEPDLCGQIFGPYFSNAAKALYTDPSIGGSVTPGVKFKSKPPKKVKKKKVKFRLGGSGSTPLGFRCKLDHKSWVNCSNKVTLSKLSLGKHAFRGRSIDQTDRQSSKKVTWKFRVKKKGKAK